MACIFFSKDQRKWANTNSCDSDVMFTPKVEGGNGRVPYDAIVSQYFSWIMVVS